MTKKDTLNLSRREFGLLGADAMATSSLTASSPGAPKATASTKEHLPGVLLESQSPYTNKIAQRNGPYCLLFGDDRKKVTRIMRAMAARGEKRFVSPRIGICDMYQSFVFAEVLLMLRAAQRWQAQ